MKTKRIVHIILLALVSGGLLFSSCSKDDDVQELPRIFSPIEFKAAAVYDIIELGMVTLSWNKRDSAVSYTVELYKDDSLAFDESKRILLREGISKNQDTIIVKDLDASTRYSARLRANAANPSKDSKFNKVTFKVPEENIFIYGVNPDSITDVDIAVAWFGGSRPVTRITFKTDGESAIEHTLTAGEQSASRVDLQSILTAGRRYTITAFNESVKRGSVSIRTADVYKRGGGAIDFLGELAAIPDGGILALDANEYTYGTSRPQLTDKSFTLKGISGGRTVLKSSGSGGTVAFNLPKNAPTAAIVLQNLALDANGTAEITQYFFNQQDSCKVGKIWLDGCYIKDYSSTLLRFQNDATNKVVDTLVISNCIITNISQSQNYAIVHVSATNSVINNIQVSNSTIYNTGLGVIQHDKSASKTVSISNCTMHDMLRENTRSIINYSTNDVGSIQISNCIFGATKTGARGIAVNESTLVTVTNSYKTSDFDDTSGDTYTIPNLVSYSGASNALFQAPSGDIGTADFSFKDQSFIGKTSVGDPRWR